MMPYSNKFIKGAIGYTAGGMWPIIVMERARSDAPMTPVLCEVWGFEQEMGSCYLKDITLTSDYDTWRAAIINKPQRSKVKPVDYVTGKPFREWFE